MLCQTIDELLPVLQMLPQPAFCLREDGTVVCNQAARHLAPASDADLGRWLGAGAAAFSLWDRSGTLELPVIAASRSYSAVLRPVRDGLMCLLRELEEDAEEGSAMAVASQVLRMPLTDLSAQVQQLAEQTEDERILLRTVAMQRQLYRISRITANLTDLELLRTNQYPLRMKHLNISNLQHRLQEELTDLLKETGRELIWDGFSQPVTLMGDESLLQRAVLNLVSNAVKFSPVGTTVRVLFRDLTDRILIQVENQCTDEAETLLRGAFDRLRQRDLLPDPRWGVGLGLPLVQAISRIHGGMTALEVQERTVTVTLSLSRRRSTEPPVLTSPVFAYNGGFRETLLELSDCLPNHVYHRDAL